MNEDLKNFKRNIKTVKQSFLDEQAVYHDYKQKSKLISFIFLFTGEYNEQSLEIFASFKDTVSCCLCPRLIVLGFILLPKLFSMIILTEYLRKRTSHISDLLSQMHSGFHTPLLFFIYKVR
jgi:hypothetical protein